MKKGKRKIVSCNRGPTLRRRHSWVEDEAAAQRLSFKLRLPEFSSLEVMILVQEKQSSLSPPAPGLDIVSGGSTPERAVWIRNAERLVDDDVNQQI